MEKWIGNTSRGFGLFGRFVTLLVKCSKRIFISLFLLVNSLKFLVFTIFFYVYDVQLVSKNRSFYFIVDDSLGKKKMFSNMFCKTSFLRVINREKNLSETHTVFFLKILITFLYESLQIELLRFLMIDNNIMY